MGSVSVMQTQSLSRRSRATVQVDAARKLLQAGTLAPLVAMNGLAKSYYRVLWLGTAAREGVLAAMSPRAMSIAELATALALPDGSEDGLTAWLDLGESVGLLRREGSDYELRGIARTLARHANDAVAAFYTELVELHHPLVSQTIARLREDRPFAIADADAELIARSSRIAEPYLAAAIEAVVPRQGRVRLVEVGCGSGAHIRTAAELNPALTARGLELQEDAADQARRNIQSWGLADRVTIEVGDIRDAQGTADADVVTLHQNIYYFGQDERTDVLRHLGTFLAPGGRLLVTTICRGTGAAASGLDLWCAMTRGADRLPSADELVAHLREAGYGDAQALQLTPDGMFCAFIGSNASPADSGAGPLS